MQNDIFKEVNVSSRIISLFFIIISLIIAKSLYYIIFVAILFAILFLLTNKSVKYYQEAIISVKFWLLFSLITYIIVMGSVLYSFVFTLKIMLIVLYIEQFFLTIKFETLATGINTIIYLISKKIESTKIAYNIALTIYFIRFYINSKKTIIEKYNVYERIIYVFSLKHNILPRILMATKRTTELENSLKLKNYSPKVESKNIKSKIIVYLTVFIFIVVIFKEVIL